MESLHRLGGEGGWGWVERRGGWGGGLLGRGGVPSLVLQGSSPLGSERGWSGRGR